MKIKLLLFFVLISLVTVSNAEAHTAKVVGDFKVDVGWKNEPPTLGQENAIELVITLADDYDKQRYDSIYYDIINDSDEESTASNLSGLEDTLEVDVKLGSEKKFLELEESTEFPGVYYGEYTPTEAGQPLVHIFGTIKNMEFEASYRVEKVEEGTTSESPSYSIPEWIRNNALWWSEGSIGDNDFVSGLQFLIKEGIVQVPKTESEYSDSQEIPSWIKNNAGWWANGQISDDDFVKGIQFLIQHGIISV